ncbi:MAG: hypothetical protein LDL33_11730 [Desulfomonile sp.]|nr:hypothetical protein [Desulfomonile sp.]
MFTCRHLFPIRVIDANRRAAFGSRAWTVALACVLWSLFPFPYSASAANSSAVNEGLPSIAPSLVSPTLPARQSNCERADRRVRIGEPVLYAGYLIPNRNLHGQFFTVESAGTAVAALEYADHRYPQHGYWAGLYETISFGRPADIDMVLQAWCMIPSSVPASTRYRFTGNVFESGTTWNCTSTGYSLDASVQFSWERTRPEFSQIAGVRYDHYSRRLSDAVHVPIGVVPWPASPRDTVEVEVDTWAPYIGLQVYYGYPDSVGFIRLVGAPIVVGSFAYDEFWRGGAGQRVGSTFAIRQGLFMEFLGSYRKHISDSASIGFFLKMDSVSGYGSGNLDVTPAAGQNASYRLTYRQLNYIIGANLSVRFQIPFPGGV